MALTQDHAGKTMLDHTRESHALAEAPPEAAADEEPSAIEARRPKESERPLMAFDRGPVTVEAKALAAHVVAVVEAQGRRKRARSQAQREELAKTAGRFVGELVAAVNQDTTPPVPCPKDANKLTGMGIGYRTFTKVYGSLCAAGLIEVHLRGSWQRISEFGPRTGRGKATRIKPTTAFLGIVRQHGIAKGTAGRHFPRLIPPKPLELRAGSLWAGPRKIRGSRMRFADTFQAQQLAAEVEELNAFIRSTKVEGVELTGWTRIFAEGDREGFAWDSGGRLYARPGDGSYQALPKEQRAMLRLNGEATVEIDIRSSHLAIVYALKGQSLALCMREYGEDGYWTELDPYTIGDLPRPVIKAWVTITLGAGKPPQRWPKEAAKVLREEQGIDLKTYRVQEVAKAVLERHPILSDLSGITWARLQFLESQAIVATMLRLKREFAIPALPVHDSLIVPRPGWWVAFWVLKGEVLKATGHLPLQPKLSVGLKDLPAPHQTPYPVEIN